MTQPIHARGQAPKPHIVWIPFSYVVRGEPFVVPLPAELPDQHGKSRCIAGSRTSDGKVLVEVRIDGPHADGATYLVPTTTGQAVEIVTRILPRDVGKRALDDKRKYPIPVEVVVLLVVVVVITLTALFGK